MMSYELDDLRYALCTMLSAWDRGRRWSLKMCTKSWQDI